MSAATVTGTEPPLVSCIVPARNAERFIAATLDSVLAQRARPIEIIVVDDGSTDRTAAIVEGYGEAVCRLVGPATGPAQARNVGVARAAGRFVAFIDADDLWHADKLERQLARFAADPTLDLCVTHVQNFRGDVEFVGAAVPGYYMPALLVRRDALAKVGPFDGALLHSSELNWFMSARRLGLHEAILPETLVYRRLHDRNMSSLGADDSLREHLKILRGAIHRRQ